MHINQLAKAELGDAYNPFDQQFLDDPHPVYDALHREAPVCWSEHFEAYLVTRYEDVVEAVNSPAFASEGKSGPAPPMEVLEELGAGYPMTEMLYSTDPPEHTRLRALIATALSQRLVESFEPSFTRSAHEVVDRFVAAGHADLYEDYVEPLLDMAILDFVGVAREDQDEVREWHHTWESLFIPGREPDDLRSEARKVVKYQHYLAALAEQRRAEPRDDLMTALVNARAAERAPLSAAEIVWGTIEIVGAAGNTHYGMANVLFRLLEDSERWASIRDRRGLLPAAVEEGMRVESPVLGCARETAEPVEIGGVQLPQGAPVLIAFAAANHDGSAFPHADCFEAARDNVSRQVTLGRGPHYCVGARLARMMIARAVDVLMDRVPQVRLEQGWQPVFEAPFPFLRSIATLPVRWTAAA